jgi:hypothetical protein
MRVAATQPEEALEQCRCQTPSHSCLRIVHKGWGPPFKPLPLQ